MLKKIFNYKNNFGFTLVEMVVTISLIVIFSAGVIFYSAGLREQMAVFRDQAKVVSLIYKAKGLSVSTYNRETGDVPCAYGIHLEETSVSIFRLEPLAGECSDYQQYENGNVSISLGPVEESIQLADTVLEISGARDFIFVPPDPRTYFAGGSDSEIVVRSSRNYRSSRVVVGVYGQINFVQEQ